MNYNFDPCYKIRFVIIKLTVFYLYATYISQDRGIKIKFNIYNVLPVTALCFIRVFKYHSFVSFS